MMNRYRIHTPVPGHTEVIGTVGFVQGVAECEAEPTAAPLMYFRAQGYRIEIRDANGDWVPETPPARLKGPDAAALLQAENEALKARLAELEAASSSPAGDTASKPAGNASTETWRAWAVEHGGMDADEAAAATRDQLAERFATKEQS